MTDLDIAAPHIPQPLNKDADDIPARFSDETAISFMEICSRSFYGQSGRLVEFRSSRLEKVDMGECRLAKVVMLDVIHRICDFSNTRMPEGRFDKVEFQGCKMLGVDFTLSYLKNLRFVDCILRYSLFRYARFNQVEFVRCDLTKADFQSAGVSGVRFRDCKLNHAEFSGAKLAGTDFRGTEIEGIKVGIQELPGSVVDPFQALYLSTLLGFTIEDAETPSTGIER